MVSIYHPRDLNLSSNPDFNLSLVRFQFTASEISQIFQFTIPNFNLPRERFQFTVPDISIYHTKFQFTIQNFNLPHERFQFTVQNFNLPQYFSEELNFLDRMRALSDSEKQSLSHQIEIVIFSQTFGKSLDFSNQLSVVTL